MSLNPMQHLGVPETFVVCMIETLQGMEHQVCTAYGNSDTSYGGPYQIIPMHGKGQGNGASQLSGWQSALLS